MAANRRFSNLTIDPKYNISKFPNNSSLYSAEKVGSSEDLIRVIFLYLPVRSLIRFKLVSQLWSSLISDPQFAQERTHQLNPNSIVPSGLFFYNSLAKSEEIESVSLDDSRTELSRVRVPSLSFLNTVAVGGSKIMILQSCNGLLLCKFKGGQNKYCVCNPTTKKSKILPQVIVYPRERASGFTLAFDTTVSPHYKVICVVTKWDTWDRQIRIYSSETGKWHTSDYCCHKLFFSYEVNTGLYWNGSIHWIESARTQYYSFEYNLEKDVLERYRMHGAPRSINFPKLYIGESKGCLHLVFVQTRWSKNFKVLERDRETWKWSVKYCVDMTHLLSQFPEICVELSKDHMCPTSKVEYVFSILSIYNGEKEEDSTLVLAIRGKVISYNLHDKTSKVICELPSQVVDTSDYCCYRHGTSFNFIETLASV